jgi:hypothetical protein
MLREGLSKGRQQAQLQRVLRVALRAGGILVDFHEDAVHAGAHGRRTPRSMNSA